MGAVDSKVNVDAVKNEVASAPIVMYTKPNCGFCSKARRLLSEAKLTAHEVDLDQLKRDNPSEAPGIINGLVYTTRQTSVPQVFICGKFVGGFTELNQLQEAGRLLDAVNECAAEKD